MGVGPQLMRDSSRKRCALIVAAGCVLLLVVGVIAWQLRFAVDSVVRAASPDGRYTATVESDFGSSCNRFDVQVEDRGGALIRHLSVTDKLPGWAADPSIAWASDSQTVTIGLEDPDAGIAVKLIVITMP